MTDEILDRCKAEIRRLERSAEAIADARDQVCRRLELAIALLIEAEGWTLPVRPDWHARCADFLDKP